MIHQVWQNRLSIPCFSNDSFASCQTRGLMGRWEPALLTYAKLSSGSPLLHILFCSVSQSLESLNFFWPLRVSSLVLPWVSPSQSFIQSTHCTPGSCWEKSLPENQLFCSTPHFPTPYLSPKPIYWNLSYPSGTSELINTSGFIDTHLSLW